MRYLTVFVVLLAGCSWQEPTPADLRFPDARIAVSGRTSSTSVNSQALVAATIAQQQLGVRYRYGGAGPGGFDCSGLVHYAYAQAGLSVPRTTGSLWRAARDIGGGEPRPGDVLFFNFDGKPSHVGIYVGDDYFVHAPSTGKTVTTAQMSDAFYAERLLRIGRLTR